MGTSTGSLLISHLALKEVEKIRKVYTSVNESSIFNNRPFLIKHKHGVDHISINHFNVIRNFLQGKKTFGESKNLKNQIIGYDTSGVDVTSDAGIDEDAVSAAGPAASEGGGGGNWQENIQHEQPHDQKPTMLPQGFRNPFFFRE